MTGGPSEQTRLALLEARVTELENFRNKWAVPRIEKLESFRALVLTVGTIVGAIVGFMGDAIKKRLGLG
jgi:hypothetical protein